MLPPETIAIVAATAPDVQARKAIFTFRMWHHMQNDDPRRQMFEEFAIGDRMIGLIEAIIEAASHERRSTLKPRIPRPLSDQTRTALQEMLEPAFLLALRDVLGVAATAMVLNAWKQAFRNLILQT